nr:hypothetical protein CFP56_58184 [Quercus suber]
MAAMMGNTDGYNRKLSLENKSSPTTATDVSPVHRLSPRSDISAVSPMTLAPENRIPKGRRVEYSSAESVMSVD